MLYAVYTDHTILHRQTRVDLQPKQNTLVRTVRRYKGITVSSWLTEIEINYETMNYELEISMSWLVNY